MNMAEEDEEEPVAYEVATGADHGGFELKEKLVSWLRGRGLGVLDVGAKSMVPDDDYPDFAAAVAELVASGRARRGIVVCGSGVGACVAANKVAGARACLCHDHYSARQGVEHDDMNILCLGARVVEAGVALELVGEFLSASFTNEGKYRRRLKKVLELEWRGSQGAGSHPGFLQVNPGRLKGDVDEALEDFEEHKLVTSIWARDHTVWKPDPGEIADRLGWLDVLEEMRFELEGISSFAEGIRDEGYRDLVLLGMGGSSLAPEVLGSSFGDIPGYPRLTVLDSTVPEAIRSVAEATGRGETLYLVSSKSGTTIETMSLLRYFFELESAGTGGGGRNFVAITDAGTPLAEAAEGKAFRRIFINPSDIGGRYSALSYFGLVPAALTGIDTQELVNRAGRMRESCKRIDLAKNPGVLLGTYMGSLALLGRDKLTVLTSPSVSDFGLWIEQLIAESTGKQGRGLVPVTGEPVATPSHYAEDRQFVCLRLRGDDNAGLDAACNAIAGSGQPVTVIDVFDKYDLGGQFFLWEFATAVVGAAIDINPFDQPDVQLSKDITSTLLRGYSGSGELPEVEPEYTVERLLESVRPGDYLAVMAYMQQAPELDAAFSRLRALVVEKYRIATTIGYGPRFLHSTGQLHKGGGNNGVFLQVTSDHAWDARIPGTRYTFGVLADSEARGDLRALLERGRRVAAVRARGGTPACIDDLIRTIDSA